MPHAEGTEWLAEVLGPQPGPPPRSAILHEATSTPASETEGYKLRGPRAIWAVPWRARVSDFCREAGKSVQSLTQMSASNTCTHESPPPLREVEN